MRSGGLFLTAVLCAVLSFAGAAAAQPWSLSGEPSASRSASLVATLSPAGGFANFVALAASSNIVVAAGNVTDVFTKSPAGWQGGGPAASLVDPATTEAPTGLSISSNTVVEGLHQAKGGSGIEDVFVEPVDGWSGAIAPAARLVAPQTNESLTDGVISGSVIAADVSPAQPYAQRLDAAAVYLKPARGWSGQVAPGARLALPRSARTGSGLAISSNTIFVSTRTGVYVFTRPARGWSGTIKPSARLRTIGTLSAAGSAVVVGGDIFTKPRHGWAGTVAPVARVISSHAGDAQLGGQASSAATVVSGIVGRIPPGGCVNTCTATVTAATKPRNGWSGAQHATTILHTLSGTGLLPVALVGRTLSVTGGGPIDIYQLAGG